MRFQQSGKVDGSTVSKAEYSAKKGERYAVTKPADSNLLKGDGSFTGQTQNSQDFKPGKGDRYDAVRRGSNEVWKVGSFSLNHILFAE